VNYENPGDADDVAELTSPLELIDVRLGIEPNMVQLAVLNATGRDIERLAQRDRADGALQRRQRELHALGHRVPSADFGGTRNPLMVWVYRQINAVRTHGQWAAIMKDKVLTPDRIAEYNHSMRRCTRRSARATWRRQSGSSPAICISRGASWSARRRAAANECARDGRMPVRGGPLRGARSPLRPVVACHCTQCRRMTGHFLAATAAREPTS